MTVDLLLRDMGPELADDDEYPEFDRTRSDYWNHWLMQDGETACWTGETALTMFDGPRRVWSAERATVTLTEHRLLMAPMALMRVDGTRSMGAAGFGHLRYEWITSMSRKGKGGWLARSFVSLGVVSMEGRSRSLTVQDRRTGEVHSSLVSLIRRFRGLPRRTPTDDSMMLSGAVPVGQRLKISDIAG